MVYDNAPIKEAIFDIRFDNANLSQPEDLKEFHDEIKTVFADMKTQFVISGSVHIGGDDSVQSEPGKQMLSGYVFLVKDKSRQIKVGANNFTYNVLAPYRSWDEHFTEFIEIWKKFQFKFKCSGVKRVATRYINKIDIPLPINDFGIYFNNVAPIPKCLPQTFTGFITQIQVPTKDNLKNVILTQTIENPKKDTLPYIVDIDVYQIIDLSDKLSDISKIFNDMRVVKNAVFEDCITEETKKIFQ
jgi:uncharacterized protein (TIGR04255 family)